MKNSLELMGLQLTPGQMLKAAREDKSLSLADISQRILLGKKIVEAIEADDYDKLPAQVYAEGYLRAYAQILDLPSEDVIESFRRLKVYSDHEIKIREKGGSKKGVEVGSVSKLLKVQKFRLIFWSVIVVFLLGTLIFSTLKFIGEGNGDFFKSKTPTIVENIGDDEPILIIEESKNNGNVDDDSSETIDVPLILKPPKSFINKK